MVETKESGPGATVPGPENFSFEEYVSSVSTFPKFSHTVYLDQENGLRLLKVYNECDRIEGRGKEISAELDSKSEDSTRSLVDDEFEKLNDERDELLAEAERLTKEKLALEEKVKASAMTLHFQVGTAEKLGSVVRQAEKEYEKKHGRGRDGDLEHLSRKYHYQMEAQMEAYCIGVELPNGKKMDPPNRAGFRRLIESLIASESARLLSSLAKNLDSAESWAERLDAGFPGRSAVVADEPVGASVHQDSKVVEDSAPDIANGEGI
ncbi:hypothetical protein ABT282_07715 [Streptomyces sp. NPDC000927]|uniref:hypothetical protein n=1 Tax=Streptomyces sp. NPDC000927 TaxID=3154371 RepID=UPI003324F591